MKLDPIVVSGDRFLDSSGRGVMLRGVNLGGDCKLPYPYGGTNYPSDFSDHRDVTFIGRPFPLGEADEHLGRLAHWGFNVVRLLTTWEAVEHAGPGQYDEDYLDYLAEVVRRAEAHGLYVMLDFHEDVWSRMTGGSGAPGWTFEAVGLDFTKFNAAGAAHVMQHKYDYALGGWQEAYPQMSWGANHRLPPTGIMWTLFFTGRLFTPDFHIDGRNVQDFLQGHYLGAMEQVARRLAPMPGVLGFDTLNEPVHGWIGQPLSYRHVAVTPERPVNPRVGLAMSPLDNLLAARGIPVEAPRIVRDAVSGKLEVGGTDTVNPNGVSIWLDGRDCPFERAGAYTMRGDTAVAGREDFFCAVHSSTGQGRELTMQEDAYAALFHAVAGTVRAHREDWAVFAEMEPYSAFSGAAFPAGMPERSVNASHWYDGAVIYTKRFDPEQSFDFVTNEVISGIDPIRTRYIAELGRFRGQADTFSSGGAPVLIGEFGIPFDLEHGAAYKAWAEGDRSETPWTPHVTALSLMYDALDALGYHATQWNYTATNRNDLAIGDGWNQEDLSIFSRDQQDDPADPDSGGRAIKGFCRPYVRRVAGMLEGQCFDWANGTFTASWQSVPEAMGSTEIYIPRIHFGMDLSVEFAGEETTWLYDETSQLLYVEATAPGLVHATVTAKFG
ncbi:cellulase family glycosylhydrolase [Novosphingobium resinovorum]|uniref:glycoside hydrolase family 5 protein n=1 Tax=Novosphingobium resinovorum TaxID=158500 RepID=UPI002ED3F64C|nr:cellulase family glycosylhydrolase [Novosphingobium resinovorum]